MRSVDLHLHSFYSDGADTPTDVARKAKSNGLGLISLTDHDSNDGSAEFLEESKKQGISSIPGVEITTMEYHMLGYCFDTNDKDFKEFVKRSQDLQREVCKKRVEKLQEYGVPINFEDVANKFPNSTLGKMAIMRIMLSDENCIEYLKKENDPVSFKPIFNFYLSWSGIAHKVETDDCITWNESAYEIHKAGGIVIAAHPPLYAKDPSELEEHFKVVDGLEVQPQFAEQNVIFENYAIEKGMALTYGSDYHEEGYQKMLTKGECFLDKITLKILGLS
jgi:predicted metal-dependent phosphoesterase TrpH